MKEVGYGSLGAGFWPRCAGVAGMTHPRGFMHCHEDFVGSDEIKLYISQLVEDSGLG